MIDKKHYQNYIEAAKFWVKMGERINNCITDLRNDAPGDKNFVDLVIHALQSAKKMCIYRVNVMDDKVTALETLFGEEKNND